jgi:hypothetical protein
MSIAWVMGYPDFLFKTWSELNTAYTGNSWWTDLTSADDEEQAKRMLYYHDVIQPTDLDSTFKYTFPSGRNPIRLQAKHDTWNIRRPLPWNDMGVFVQLGQKEIQISFLVRFTDPSEGDKLESFLMTFIDWQGRDAMQNQDAYVAPFVLFDDALCVYNDGKSGCTVNGSNSAGCDGRASKITTDPRYCRRVGNYVQGVSDGSGYSRPYRLVYLNYFEEIREANRGDDVREYLVSLIDMGPGKNAARVFDTSTTGQTIVSQW